MRSTVRGKRLGAETSRELGRRPCHQIGDVLLREQIEGLWRWSCDRARRATTVPLASVKTRKLGCEKAKRNLTGAGFLFLAGSYVIHRLPETSGQDSNRAFQHRFLISSFRDPCYDRFAIEPFDILNWKQGESVGG